MSEFDALCVLGVVVALVPWFVGLFEKQKHVLRSAGKRIAILCGRRSGKTVAAAAGLAEALHNACFDEAVVYAARTRDVAKRLIWGKLHKLASDNALPWTFIEGELTIRNEKGGYILVVGLDKPAEIEKLRGLKIRRFIGDEPATYAAILETLMDEILEPATADIDGDIWFVGTPGKVLAGFWYEISTNTRPDEEEEADDEEPREEWEIHHWTMFDNPFMPNARRFLDRVLRRKGWTEAHPTIQQEYFGRWVPDNDGAVYKYNPKKNDVFALPANYRADKWIHTLCVDFGISDNFAWSLLASHPRETKTYVIGNGAAPGQLISEMADVLLGIVTTHNVHELAGDPGGGGAALILEWNKRYVDRAGGLRMIAAKKTEKLANIRILSSELLSGNLLLLQPSCKELASEITVLPWANEQRVKEHPSYPNDRADSMLYAFRHHYAYLHTDTKSAPSTEPDDPSRIDAELESYQRRRRTKSWLNERAAQLQTVCSSLLAICATWARRVCASVPRSSKLTFRLQ